MNSSLNRKIQAIRDEAKAKAKAIQADKKTKPMQKTPSQAEGFVDFAGVDRILRPKQVAQMLGMPISSFYRFIKEHQDFPKGIEISECRAGYLMSEIKAFIDNLAENSRKS